MSTDLVCEKDYLLRLAGLRVTTSTNRAPVPMSFQDWYGEEKTKALMDAYKEWVESCLTASEVDEVLGKTSGDASVGGAYSGTLGKGFTTDDTQDGQSHNPVPSRFVVDAAHKEKPAEERLRAKEKSNKGKARDESARERRSVRQKAGQEPEMEDFTSSDDENDGLDEWSGRSSSEDSLLGGEHSSETDPDVPVDGAETSLQRLKRKRKELKGKRRAKRDARREARATRRSSRMIVDKPQNNDDDPAPPQDDDPAPPQDEDFDEHRMDLDPDVAPGPVALSGESGRSGMEALPASSPPPDDIEYDVMSLLAELDVAARELIIKATPDTRLGLESDTLRIARGLSSLFGMLDCDGNGLEFMLLPFNEFLQAEGGEELKGAMEALIAIEKSLLGGYMGDTRGRKKAVIPVAMRPPIVTGWIQNGRCRVGKTGTPMARMVIKPGDIPKFLKAWSGWWAALQPEWRVRRENGGWERDTYGEDWHTMIIPGQNGLLSVIAALSWWGSAVKLEGKGETEWLDAVADVEWMLVGLVGRLEARESTA